MFQSRSRLGNGPTDQLTRTKPLCSCHHFRVRIRVTQSVNHACMLRSVASLVVPAIRQDQLECCEERSAAL